LSIKATDYALDVLSMNICSYRINIIAVESRNFYSHHLKLCLQVAELCTVTSMAYKRWSKCSALGLNVASSWISSEVLKKTLKLWHWRRRRYN